MPTELADERNNTGIEDLNSSREEILKTPKDNDIIGANGEIVGELVMEDGDPSVIVESIVNSDGSVFVDERDFNSYCNDHLSHTVEDSQSPDSQGILNISYYIRFVFYKLFIDSFRYGGNDTY